MIETERLWIRPFVEVDVDALYPLVYADPEVRDAWSGYRETLEQFRERFRTTALWRVEAGFGFRAVVRKEGDVLIGLMGFQRYDEDEDTSYIVFADGSSPVGRNPDLVEVELTYAFGRAYWGQSYATEAGRALIAEGFTRLGIGRIINAVHPDNAHRIHLMQRLGLRIEPNLYPDDFTRHGKPGVLGIQDKNEYGNRSAWG